MANCRCRMQSRGFADFTTYILFLQCIVQPDGTIDMYHREIGLVLQEAWNLRTLEVADLADFRNNALSNYEYPYNAYLKTAI